ncbi:MAG: tRNA glutamyl-Q(34) synthetase GluQRS [Parvularculaceae bacterium]|nr:tRNA glutamyl-Q(34) synthetase GluQRS [Parvularculaceae bacterium]
MTPIFLTRFAPSPTGFLHLGHAFSALTAFQAARRAGGRFILRIEDIDSSRCKPEYETAILEDLAWLGAEWEKPVRRQSEHLADYQSALEGLIARGLVYRCFKTRTEILDEIARAPHLSPDGPEGAAYVGAPLAADEEQSLLADGASFAWRLSVAAAREALGAAYERLQFIVEDESGERIIPASPQIFGDAVLARKGLGTSYHLASTHDDALQGVTHVIRGEDLAAAAHLHTLIYALFDWPPPRYRHHRLVTDDQGRRLAKRDKAVTLRALRAGGATAGDVRRRLGFSD